MAIVNETGNQIGTKIPTTTTTTKTPVVKKTPAATTPVVAPTQTPEDAATTASIQAAQAAKAAADAKALQDSANASTDAQTAAMNAQLKFMQNQQAAADAMIAADKAKVISDARTVLSTVLDSYGLGSMADFVYKNIVTSGVVDMSNPDAVIYAIKTQPEYQKRFAANTKRVSSGLPELDPASYIAMENSYRNTMKQNGLPEYLYNEDTDFQALISGDVSPQELQSRVTEGYNAVAQADPTVKAQMKELYGVTDAQLAAYFLDPTKTSPALVEQAKAANIAARGKELSGIQLDKLSAQDLVQRGITFDQATQGFTKIGQMGELNATIGAEQNLTEQQKISGTFGFDIEAQKALEKKRQGRLAEFNQGGGYARAAGTSAGTITSGLGISQ